MRDLEIRGAGNILGTQQSGHIAAVGYELYCRCWRRRSVSSSRLPPRETVDVSIDLPVEAYLPAGYVPDMRSKIDLYRRLARASSIAQVEDFAGELSDRFGALPPPVERLLEMARLRVCAHGWGVQTIRREDNYLVLGYTERSKASQLVERSGGRLRIADHQSAYLPLPPGKLSIESLLDEVKALLRPQRDAA